MAPPPKKPEDLQRHRLPVQVTLRQLMRYRALADYLETPLSEIIRQYLETRIARLEARGIRLKVKRRR